MKASPWGRNRKDCNESFSVPHGTAGRRGFTVKDCLPGSADYYSGALHFVKSTSNCQEKENYMVWASHALPQPLPNHPSGHLGAWATQRSAQDLLDGQRQRLDVPAHAGTTHDSLSKKRLEEYLCRIIRHALPTSRSIEGLN